MTASAGILLMLIGVGLGDPAHITLFCCGTFLMGSCKVANAIREMRL